MQTSRHTIYDILKRWATEGHAGLDDKPPVPHEPARKVTFEDIQEVRRLARNPDLGAYRVMAAHEQIGIKLSQRTCGRLLELNRNLCGGNGSPWGLSISGTNKWFGEANWECFSRLTCL